MIRVVYRWKVKEENFADFKKVWVRTTNHIHETVPGAGVEPALPERKRLLRPLCLPFHHPGDCAKSHKKLLSRQAH